MIRYLRHFWLHLSRPMDATRYELAARAMSDCIWDWNLVTDKVWRSSAYQSFFGHPMDHITKRRTFWRENCHPDDYKRTAESFRQAVTGKDKFWSAEYRFRRADGSFATVCDRGFLLYDKKGKPVRAIGAIEDITGRKIHEEKLSLAKEAAESDTREKGELLGKVSNEVRTSLSVIKGFCELLDQPIKDSQQQKKFVSIIQSNCDHMLRLVNHVLSISNLESQQSDESVSREGFAAFLEEVGSDCRALIGGKNLTFSFHCEGQLPNHMYVDLRRIKDIVCELIHNAVRFTEEGTISLVCGCAPLPGVGASLTFSVIDTGCGFTPEELTQVFTPFYRGSPLRDRKHPGSGMGLYLCQKLARKVDGSIAIAQSGENAGTTVTLSVVVRSATGGARHWPVATASRQRRDNHEAVDLTGHRILFVDDSQDIRDLMITFLELAGAEIDFAVDGEDGFKKALAGNHDIVIMDLQMPVMNGYEVTSRLRREGYKKPIIALTANVLGSLKDKCRSTGFDDYLLKPIHRETLLEKIHHHTMKQ